MSDISAQLRETFETTITRIREIDSTLDPASAGRLTVINQAVAAAENSGHAAILGELTTLLSSVDPQVLVGVVTDINRYLKKEYSAKVDEYVTENVVSVEPVSDEVAAQLNDERSTLVTQAKAARDLLVAFGTSDDELSKVPTKRGRAKGVATGPRLKGTYNFSIDGTPVDGHKLGDLQKALEASSVAVVKDAITSANAEFNFAEPPEEFRFEFEGKVIVAKATNSDETDDEVEDNEPEADEFSFDN